MKPSYRKHVVEAASSLEDSTFEVIPSDSSFLTSDDEDAHTESLASTDGYTGDEISSIADTEEAEDEGDQLDEEDESSGEDLGGTNTMSSRQLGCASIIDTAIHDGLTIHASSLGDIQRHSVLLQKGVSADRAELDICRETLEVESFDHSNMPAVFREHHMPKLRIQRHLSRSERILRPSEAFRVWYFGEPDHKADILDKLGSALYMGRSLGQASPTTPDGAIRYNVTPVSSFTRDVTLLPSSGVDLYVTECVVQSVDLSGKDMVPTVTISLDDNVEVEMKPDGSVRVPYEWLENFWFPGIAVFCHVPAHLCMEPGYAHWPMSAAREAVSRLNIPVLDIYSASTLPKDTEKFTFGPKSLFMSLEGESAPGQDPETLVLFPIPLEQFRELDPITLNQHLECITRSSNQTRAKSNGFVSRVRQMVSSVTLTRAKTIPSQAFIFSLLATLIPVLAWLVLIKSVSLWQSINLGTDNLIALNSALTAADLGVSQTLSIPATQTPPNIVPSVTVSSAPSSIATDLPEKALGQPLLRSLFAKSNYSTEFSIHVAGDRHLTLIPPKFFQELKKRPSIHVTLSRGPNIVHGEVKELEDRTLVVELPPMEAFGTLNVTVRTTSKPMVNQTVAVDFGLSRFDVYLFNGVFRLSESLRNSRKLFETLQSRSEKAQDRLSDVTRPLMENFWITTARAGQAGKAAIYSMQSRGEAATDEAKRLGHAALVAASDAAGMVASQLQALAAHASSENIVKAWRSTNSPLKSKPVVEARKKAMTFSERLKRSSWKTAADSESHCGKANSGAKQEARKARKSNKGGKSALWN